MGYNWLVSPRNKKEGFWGPSVWTFYYDGDCGFCTKTVRWLGKLDVSQRVKWADFRALEVPPPGLSWEDLDAAAYLDCGDGRQRAGFYAFRSLTLKLPLLFPLAPLFWVPGMGIVGTRVYRWVAGNRYRLSRCDMPPNSPIDTPGPASLEDDR